jgi:hypothetical protein
MEGNHCSELACCAPCSTDEMFCFEALAVSKRREACGLYSACHGLTCRHVNGN